MPEFTSRDPRTAAFWDERFAQAFKPWDRGGVPEELRRFAGANAPLRTLIPGCGSAWELAFLRERQWEVTAIDFSSEAVAQARQRHPQWAASIVEADFFAWQPPAPLDLIYERAFLCALPRERWPDVIARWAALLPEGGRLAGYFFFDTNPKGPPFGAGQAALEAMLSPYFAKQEDVAAIDSVPVFAGRERWQVWVRRASS